MLDERSGMHSALHFCLRALPVTLHRLEHSPSNVLYHI